jgi:hypothetical protein
MSVVAGPARDAGSAERLSVQRALSWVLLLGFMGIVAIARGTYAAQGSEPSARFNLLATFGVLALLWFWFSAQIAPYQPRLMLDMGLMLLIFWFVLVPYYMWHYERWRGVGKVVLVCVAYVASLILSAVVAVVLS